MSRADWLTGTIQRWKADPVAFVRETFGVTPDRWQARALALVGKPETRRLAMKACKGPGKTAVLAWIVLWFLTCHWQSRVGCTSITEGNIDSNLWPELLKWMGRSEFLKAAFTWTKSRVSRRGDDTWFADKRTWPKSGDQQQQADALAGLHADDVMFILDESGGIPQAVMVTAEAVLANVKPSGQRSIVVQSGNPTHTTGPLYRACTVDRHLWEVVTITGDPDDPERSPRIDLTWAREQIASYGRDNPWVMVNVLGEFPPSSINTLLGVEEVEKAMRRHYQRPQYSFAERRIGVDVARFGDDRTVLAPRQGLAAFRPVILRGADSIQIASRVAKGYHDWHADIVLIDDSGHWGHGAVDLLTTSGIHVVPQRGEDTKVPDKRYKNLRSYSGFKLAEWVKAGGALPNMPEMIPEFTETTYTFVGGLFMLEPKAQVKIRLGYSPDYFDALCETFTMEDAPRDMRQQLGLPGSSRYRVMTDTPDPFASEVATMLTDFNPFDYRE